MITVNLLQLFWLILVVALLAGGLMIGSAFVTGWLVYRSRRDSHERLFPPKQPKRKGPINIDEFAPPREPEEEALPETIRKMNAMFGEVLATENLKKEKTG